MIAIEVHAIAATNHKPTRWAATTANGQRLVMSDSECSTLSGDTGRGEDCARVVAQALADKMEWSGRLHCGGTKQGYVFCFEDKS